MNMKKLTLILLVLFISTYSFAAVKHWTGGASNTWAAGFSSAPVIGDVLVFGGPLGTPTSGVIDVTAIPVGAECSGIQVIGVDLGAGVWQRMLISMAWAMQWILPLHLMVLHQIRCWWMHFR